MMKEQEILQKQRVLLVDDDVLVRLVLGVSIQGQKNCDQCNQSNRRAGKMLGIETSVCVVNILKLGSVPLSDMSAFISMN